MTKKTGKLLVGGFSSFFYSIAITLGIYIALQELHTYQNISNYLVFSFALLNIYLIELFIVYQHKNKRVELNFNINDDVNELSHFFHKIILPILLYVALTGFGYFNITSHLMGFILGFTFLAFFILFINTKAFLEHRVTAEHKTHYVYDIIKFLIFFLTTNVLINLFNSRGGDLILFSIVEFGLALVILLLMVWRIEKLYRVTFIYAFIASIVIALFFYILNFSTKLNPFQNALGLIFLFYISAAIIHHKTARTLTKGVFTEYLLVVVLVLAIAYGAN